MSGIKKIVQASSFQICIWFCKATFNFKFFKFKVVNGLFGHPV